MRKLWIAVRRFIRLQSLPKAPAGQTWLVFDDGRVAFQAPSNFSFHFEPDETIAFYPPGKESGITLRFSLHTDPLHPQMPVDVAEQFVIDHASKKKLPLTRLEDRVFLMETREESWPDRQVLMHYWQIGAGRIFVVASATIWGADRESDTIRKTLATVPQMIQSLRLT
jgi:hypothetical protein